MALSSVRVTAGGKHWGWVVSVSCCLLFTVLFGYIYSFGLIMIELLEEFDTSTTETGSIGTVAYGVGSIACLMSAPLSFKIGFRLSASIGLAACVISCVVSSFAPNVTFLFFSHGVLYGVGGSFVFSSGVNSVMGYFPTNHSGTATGIASAGTNIGLLVINPLVYALNTRYDWRTMMRIMAAILAAVGFPSIMTFSPPRRILSPPEENQCPECNESQIKDKSLSFKENIFLDGSVKSPISIDCKVDGHSRRMAKTTDHQRERLLEESRSLDAQNNGQQSSSLLESLTSEQAKVLAGSGTSPHTVHHYLQYSSRKYTNSEISGHDCMSTKTGAVSCRRSDQEPTFELSTVGSPHNEAERMKEKRRWLGRIRIFLLPDLWLLEMGFLSAGIGLSFLYFSTVNLVVTSEFSKKTGAMVMVILGVTEVIGKIILGIVADRSPTPKIFFLIAANCVGAIFMLISSQITITKVYLFCQSIGQGAFVLACLDWLPHSVGNELFRLEYSVHIWAANMVFLGVGGILGSIFGESVDKTGSYHMAYYVNMGIFLTSAMFFGLAVAYQWVFAKDRFMIFDNVRRRYRSVDKGSEDPKHCNETSGQRSLSNSDFREATPAVITERVSSV